MRTRGVLDESSAELEEIEETPTHPEPSEAERQIASFARTKKYKLLKEHMQKRIDYYQKYLPGAAPAEMTDKSNAELGEKWQIANVVIQELSALIDLIEGVASAVSKRGQ